MISAINSRISVTQRSGKAKQQENSDKGTKYYILQEDCPRPQTPKVNKSTPYIGLLTSQNVSLYSLQEYV